MTPTALLPESHSQRMPGRRRGHFAVATLLVTALAFLFSFQPVDLSAKETGRVTLSIPAANLPKEGREILALIKRGGPFKFSQDGVVFQNREKRLPLMKSGYYHEYTVPTPGAKDRGARRIVAGLGATGNVRNSGEYYYTDDHYQTFRRIKE